MKSLKSRYRDWLQSKAIFFQSIASRRNLTEFKLSLGYLAPTAQIMHPHYYNAPHKIFLYDNTCIDEGANFIISPHSEEGKFIMKQHSEAAVGLTVITNSHIRELGVWFGETERKLTMDKNKDVIVEEDVFIGANVTLLPGVKVGRGANVGAGSVCTRSVPPYAVVMGNPAKVVGFVFSPEEIAEHEVALYPESERIPISTLEKNYQMYYTRRLDEIKRILQ